MKNIFKVFILLVAISTSLLYAKNLSHMEAGNKLFYEDKSYSAAFEEYSYVLRDGTLAGAQIFYDSYNINSNQEYIYSEWKNQLKKYSKEDGTYGKYLYDLYNGKSPSYKAPKKWKTRLDKAKNLYFNENKKKKL